jgi:hypothetical protein
MPRTNRLLGERADAAPFFFVIKREPQIPEPCVCPSRKENAPLRSDGAPLSKATGFRLLLLA